MAIDLDPLELLKSELKEEDHEHVLNTLNKLAVVGVVLGPERVRKDLIPFLKEYSEIDDDEAQTGVARNLGDFGDLVGGGEHITLLLPILEHHCAVEETVVREAAVGSLKRLIPQIPPKEVVAKVVPMIKRLALHTEWFASRVSVCGLFAATYPLVPDDVKAELRAMYVKLWTEQDTPMVRKAAYVNFEEFLVHISKEHVKSELWTFVEALSQDFLDTMRTYAIDAVTAVASKFDAAENVQLVVPVVQALQDDQSWRVREQLSRQMSKLCKHVGPEIATKYLLPIYAKLLKDSEGQVRLVSAQGISLVAAEAKGGVSEYILPLLEPLSKDENEKVRSAFAKVVGGLCDTLGRETSEKVVLPILQALVKDELQDVRASVLYDMDQLAAVVGGPAAVECVVPVFLEMSHDEKWRVRLSVVEKCSAVAKLVGKDILESKMFDIVAQALLDNVFAIREAACGQIRALVELFGAEWAQQKLLDRAIPELDANSNYLQRMTILHTIASIGDLLPSDVFAARLLPILLTACKDAVANVRFGACKVLIRMGNKIDNTAAQEKLKPVLEQLGKDTDPDVKYFSEEALRLCCVER